MAFTVGTIAPLAPYSGHGGKSSFFPMPYLLNTSQTVIAGDLITVSSGKGSVDNSDVAAAVVGIALDEKTTGGSVGDNDFILIAPALPGNLFTGNLVTNGTTDLVGINFATQVNVVIGTDEDAVTGFAVLDLSEATADLIYVIGPAREQVRGLPFKSASTINPRVIWAFADGVFIANQD